MILLFSCITHHLLNPSFDHPQPKLQERLLSNLSRKLKSEKSNGKNFTTLAPPPVSSFHNFCPFEHEMLKTKVASNLRIPFLDVVSDMKYGHWYKIIQVRIVILVL